MGLFWNKKAKQTDQDTPAVLVMPPDGVAVGEFRMVISDTFTIKNQGTLITGDIVAGTITQGESVYLNGEILPVLAVENLQRQAPSAGVANQILTTLLENPLAPATTSNAATDGMAGERVGLLLAVTNSNQTLKGMTVFGAPIVQAQPVAPLPDIELPR